MSKVFPPPCIFELQVPTTFPFEIFASSTKDKLVRATYHFSGPEQTEINNPASQDFHFYFISFRQFTVLQTATEENELQGKVFFMPTKTL